MPSKTKWRLKGKKALITGATKGIGRAIADEFLDLGADIFIVSRSKEDLEAYKNEKQERGKGNQIEYFAGDISRENTRHKLLREVNKNWDNLDILVNNAGMNIRKKFQEYTSQEYDDIVKTNIRSALHLCQIFSSMMKGKKDASIVNVSSVAGMVYVKTGVVYAMSKAAMNQMTKNLAVELAPHNIRVNAVAPWYTNTLMVKSLMEDDKYKSEVLERTPLNRIAEPSEVANTAAFLSMPAASFITGQIIAVDGGFTIYGF
ncbi:MAG: SDR family oxidoreductase [Bacteroidales bacterium]|nr:SDR family oxidoreductase [Bacteroidales bacterium]MCF8327820.1 SDR family oxidoreductase [Bacteroidales bacterium]